MCALEFLCVLLCVCVYKHVHAQTHWMSLTITFTNTNETENNLTKFRQQDIFSFILEVKQNKTKQNIKCRPSLENTLFFQNSWKKDEFSNLPKWQKDGSKSH